MRGSTDGEIPMDVPPTGYRRDHKNDGSEATTGLSIPEMVITVVEGTRLQHRDM